jgi:hypothetical protein
MKTALFLVALAMHSAAFSQSVCEDLARAAEDNVKEMAYAVTDGSSDNSAPRETNRKLNQIAQSSMLNANLMLMAANKCTMPKLPVSEKSYRDSASECSLAHRMPKSGQPAPLAECDRSKWVRGK